jgi:hypothetical protein
MSDRSDHLFPNLLVQLRGVDHRQGEGWCAITHWFQEVPMSDSENDQKRELECLRLASDLTQLATETLDPNLKAHFLRMAKEWTDQTDYETIENSPLQSVSYH